VKRFNNNINNNKNNHQNNQNKYFNSPYSDEAFYMKSLEYKEYFTRLTWGAGDSVLKRYFLPFLGKYLEF
jgi:hypothetical protein